MKRLDLSEHEADTLRLTLMEAVIVDRELLRERGLGTHGMPTKDEVTARMMTHETLLARVEFLLKNGKADG